MNNQSDFPEIDVALHSLPLDKPPAGLAQNVMSAVRAQPRMGWAWVRRGLLLLFAEALIVLALAWLYLPPGFDFYLKLQLDYWLLRLQYQAALFPPAQGAALLALGLSLLAFGLYASKKTTQNHG